jgi:hypothetical protein
VCGAKSSDDDPGSVTNLRFPKITDSDLITGADDWIQCEHCEKWICGRKVCQKLMPAHEKVCQKFSFT